MLMKLARDLRKPPTEHIFNSIGQLPAIATTRFLMNAPQDYCYMAIQTLAQEIISGIRNQDGLTKEVLARHIVQGGIVAEFPASHAMMWRNLITTILNSEDEQVAELGADLEEEIEDQALKEVEQLWSKPTMTLEETSRSSQGAAFIGHLFAVDFFLLPDIWDAISSIIQSTTANKVASAIWACYEIMDAMDGSRIGEDKLELRGFCIRMQMATHQYEMTHFVEGADRQSVIDATASCGEIRAVIDKWMSIAQDSSD